MREGGAFFPFLRCIEMMREGFFLLTLQKYDTSTLENTCITYGVSFAYFSAALLAATLYCWLKRLMVTMLNGVCSILTSSCQFVY
jgi:high-affinity Fe2+/Pb2+ permease